jgi:hypothetical protein
MINLQIQERNQQLVVFFCHHLAQHQALPLVLLALVVVVAQRYS